MVLVFAALTMIAYNVLSVFLVQAEARNWAWLTAVIEVFRWPANFLVTYFGVTTLQGHDPHSKLVMMATLTTFNAAGSLVGVHLGRRLIRSQNAEKIERIENILGIDEVEEIEIEEFDA